MVWIVLVGVVAVICIAAVAVLLLRRRVQYEKTAWARPLPTYGGFYREALAQGTARPRKLVLRRGPDLLALARAESEGTQPTAMREGSPDGTE